MNRAKSRDRTNYNNVSAYHGWGYAWFVNRRVLYNNNNTETAGFDVADFPMGPDQCSRLFVSTNTSVLNYSRFYRTIHRLADVPKNAAGAIPAFHVNRSARAFPVSRGALRVSEDGLADLGQEHRWWGPDEPASAGRSGDAGWHALPTSRWCSRRSVASSTSRAAPSPVTTGSTSSSSRSLGSS